MSILTKKLELINKLEKLDEIIKICSVNELQDLFIELLISECSLEYLEKVRKQLPNLNFGDVYEYESKGRQINPLLWACRQQNFELIKYLVECGSDVNRLSYGYKTNSIMFCFQNGDAKSYKYLLTKGAKLEIGNQSVGNFPPTKEKLTEFLIALHLIEEKKDIEKQSV